MRTLLYCLLFSSSFVTSVFAQLHQEKLYIDDGTGKFMMLQSSPLGASRALTLPDPGGAASLVLSTSSAGQTIGGGLTINNGLALGTVLSVLNGGTGGANASDAMTNLLPSQTGHSGELLTTNGTGTLSWTTVGAAPFTVFFGNSGGNLANNTFIDLGGNGLEAVENQASVIATRSGTLKNLFVKLATAPGGANSRTFTVRLNGVNTTLALTVVGASTTGSNTLNTQAVSAFDQISIQTTNTGAPAGSVGMVAFELQYWRDDSTYRNSNFSGALRVQYW